MLEMLDPSHEAAQEGFANGQEVVVFQANPILNPQEEREFETFYSELRGKVFNFNLKRVRDPELAEDLTQDTFLRALTHWDSFRHAGTRSNWAFSIANNLVIDQSRRMRNVGVYDEETAVLIKDPSPTPEEETMQRSVIEDVLAVVATLTSAQRTAIEQRLFQDRGGEDIASNIGKSHLATRALICRGMQTLRANPGLAEAAGF